MNSAVAFFTTFLLAVVSVSNATSCKMTEKLHHCADPPLQVKDDTPWCPIRVCALSYKPSHACPRDDFAATHKCETIKTNREVWKCTNAEPPVIIALPVGCDDVGSTVSCVETIKACDCKAETKDVVEYRPQFPYHPICSSDGDIIEE